MPRNQFSVFKNLMFNLYRTLPPALRRYFVSAVNKGRVGKIYKLKSPSTLIFYVTDRCNAKCKHCFYWKSLNNKDDEISLENTSKVSNSLKRPLDLLVITGGEPFLRNDIVAICGMFYKNNGTKRISIDTNGILSSTIHERVREILKSNPSKHLSVFISLDGMEKTHDVMRGCKGSFSAVEKTLGKLKELESQFKNLNIMVATTVTKDNLNELGDLINFVKKYGILHKFNILRSNSMVFNVDRKFLNDFDPQKIDSPSFYELEKVYNLVSRNKDLGSRIEAMKLRNSIDMLKSKKGL